MCYIRREYLIKSKRKKIMEADYFVRFHKKVIKKVSVKTRNHFLAACLLFLIHHLNHFRLAIWRGNFQVIDPFG